MIPAIALPKRLADTASTVPVSDMGHLHLGVADQAARHPKRNDLHHRLAGK